ncbi:MAG: helix-turn-helix transcriptional regulator [Alistipes indistinctus]
MNPNIGNKIKQLREEHQLSLAELAANASIYPMQLEKIESGEIQPTMAIVVQHLPCARHPPGHDPRRRGAL